MKREYLLVGMAGFEPAASCSQSVEDSFGTVRASRVCAGQRWFAVWHQPALTVHRRGP
jgi:hypothetical protein